MKKYGFALLLGAGTLTALTCVGASLSSKSRALAASATPTVSVSGLSVPQPDEHPLSAMADENTTTWGWLHTPTTGSYIQVDYGEVVRIKAFSFDYGYGESFADTFSGTIKMSADGSTFYTMGSFAATDHICTLDLSANAYYFRYVRITDMTAAGWLAIREFEATTLTAVSKATFTASNVTLVADGGYTGPSYVNTPADATDDDPASYAWYLRSETAGAYFQIDLGATTSVSSLQLLMASPTHISDYIQTTINYTYATDLNGTFTSLGSSDGSRRQVFLAFSAVNARYIRATIPAASSSSSNDIVIRDFSVNKDIAFSSDLLVYDDDRSGYPLSCLDYGTDNNEATFIDFDGTNRGSASWFQRNLDALTPFSGIKLITGKETGDKVTAVTFSISNDGTTFTDIGSYSSADGLYSISYEGVYAAHYLRASALSSGWMTINEFAVTGPTALAEFNTYLDALTCDDIRTVAKATTAKSNLTSYYGALSASEIAQITSERLNKYNYYLSYCNHIIAAGSGATSISALNEGGNTGWFILALCALLGAAAATGFLMKKNNRKQD